ncbi:MAG: hypothetical protein V3S70_10585, partial [Gammaproteobacteria bacterium]
RQPDYHGGYVDQAEDHDAVIEFEWPLVSSFVVVANFVVPLRRCVSDSMWLLTYLHESLAGKVP